MGSLEIRPVHSTGDLRRVHPAARSGSTATSRTGWRRCCSSASSSSTGARTRSSSTARAEYFLACATAAPVGRITAQVDDNFQAFQDNHWGWFGFFECEDDPEAAAALLDRAEQWLRGQGCDRMVGPADFTTNDECGVLIEGHDRTPLILTPWTHRYYPRAARGRRAWPRRWTC